MSETPNFHGKTCGECNYCIKGRNWDGSLNEDAIVPCFYLHTKRRYVTADESACPAFVAKETTT